VYPVENIRKRVIDTAYICGKSSHLGSSLSLVDILAVLIKEKLYGENEIVLSKGHGVLAWYATLTEYNYITQEMLNTFQQNDSELSVLAVENRKLELTCSTGSLGQGMSVATGMAIAKKRLSEPGMVYVIIGNGEADEGIVWEAAMLASQQKLNNLCVIVDHNHFQSDGSSVDIIDLDHMAKIRSAYGFEALELNGHDCREICEALAHAENSSRPTALVCNTIKGYGIKFMENSAQWHHNRLTEERYICAKELLERRKND
jgi:transketolase